MKHDHSHEGEVNHKIDVPEGLKQKIAQVKEHLKENRKAYLIGAGVAGFSFATGKYFKRPIEVTVDFKPVINNMPTFNNNNIGNVVQNNVGRVSKVIRDADTGQEWQKIRYLAEKISAERDISYDHARLMLNRHFRGELESVFDKRYEIAGLRTDL